MEHLRPLSSVRNRYLMFIFIYSGFFGQDIYLANLYIHQTWGTRIGIENLIYTPKPASKPYLLIEL
jgi:hypothetical protein